MANAAFNLDALQRTVDGLRLQQETVQRELTELQSMMGNLGQFKQRVKLNVGGIKFETTLSTLTRYPESMLGAMFSGRHDVPADDDGYVFIDRDGTHFRIILNFMRTGSLDGPVSPTAASELKRELEYYQLPVPFASQTLPKTVAIHTQRRPTPPAQSRPQRTYKPQKEKPEGCVELFIGNLPWSIDDDKIVSPSVFLAALAVAYLVVVLCAASDRSVYALLTLLAFSYYHGEYEPAQVRRCPSWMPIPALRVVCTGRLQHAARFVLFLSGALLVILDPSVAWPLRLLFGVSVAVLDVCAFSTHGGHGGFICLYTAFALVMPGGPTRSALLRLIVSQQLGSSGLHKLRIGGACWAASSPLNAVGEMIRHALESPLRLQGGMLHEPSWLLQRKLAQRASRPWLCKVMGVGGLLLELGVPLLLLVMPHTGPLMLHVLLAALACFHVSIALLTGIHFPFNVACYCATLLPPPSIAARTGPHWLPVGGVAAALCWASVRSKEDWPLNALALFPYSGEQMRRLARLVGRYRLALEGSTDSVCAGPCAVQSCLSGCPSVLYPPVAHVLLAAESHDITCRTLKQALQRLARRQTPHALLLEPSSWRPFATVQEND